MPKPRRKRMDEATAGVLFIVVTLALVALLAAVAWRYLT